jgi:hypothetical protein
VVVSADYEGTIWYHADLTIHVEDRYNFNPDEKDISTGIPDWENGQFEIAGLAKQYMNFATVIRHTKWAKGEREYVEILPPSTPDQRPKMITCMRKTKHLLTGVLLTAVFSTGCDMKNGKVSDDIVEFRNLVETDLRANSVRWEIFGTPEYTGGVPGPTDYITLIAEVEPWDQERFEARPKTGKEVITPEAARPWLTEGFRVMLAKHRNASTDLSSMYNCRKFEAKIKKSQRPVNGFICNRSGRSLVYLTLADHTGS